MQRSSVSIDVDGGVIPTEVLAATDTTNTTAVLVVPSIFGPVPELLGRLEELTDRALVLVPDPFWRTGEGWLAYDQRDAAFGRLADFDFERCTDELAAVAARARRDGADRVIALGICFGGYYALRLAAGGLVDGVVTWHGSRMEHALAEAGSVTCPLRLHFGEADPITPRAVIDAVREAFAGHPDVDVVVHPDADHGYSHDGPAWDPAASRAGLEAVVELTGSGS
jgi:carboxymethylenebutenolidase